MKFFIFVLLYSIYLFSIFIIIKLIEFFINIKKERIKKVYENN